MKKLFLVILALSLLVPAAFAENASQADEVWYAIIIETQGQYVPVSSFGVDSKLILSADGSCISENASPNGNYSATGTFEWQDKTLVTSFPETGEVQYTMDDDGYLCYTSANSVTYYTRNPEEYAKYASVPSAAPEPVAAESEEDFLGQWVLSTVYLGDQQYAPEEANVFLAFIIEQGHITVYDNAEMQSVAADYYTELVNHGLHFVVEDGTDEEHVLSKLYMTTDGDIMASYLTSNEEPLTMVFTRANQAAQ